MQIDLGNFRVYGLAMLVTLVAAAPANAWETAEAFWTPTRTTYCEMQRTAGHTRLGCSVNRQRDGAGYTTIYTLDAFGRVKRTTTQGQGGVEFPSLSYNHWYSMYGGTVKRGKATGTITCIVRRASGLHCSNPGGHGFVLSAQRQRTF